MKTASAIIEAPRFPVEWIDDPDNNPPPGKQVAQALLADLLSSGDGLRSQQLLGNHAYEHSAWHFGFDFESAHFWISLQGHPDNLRQPATCLITIEKNREIIAALFNRPDSISNVPENCVNFVQESIRRVFGVEQIQWLEYDEAYEMFCRL